MIDYPIVLEKDIPLPPRKAGRGPKVTSGRPLLYPFDTMDVMVSFLVPAGKNWETAISSANRWALQHGGRFEYRKSEEGVRIWRVE